MSGAEQDENCHFVVDGRMAYGCPRATRVPTKPVTVEKVGCMAFPRTGFCRSKASSTDK